MKAVGVAAAIFGMIGAVAAQTCCEELYIVNAKFEMTAGDTDHMRRLGNGAPHRALQPTQLQACTDGRKPLVDEVFDAQGAEASWMVHALDASTTTEPVFTRAIIDLSLEDTYWSQDDGAGGTAPIAAAKRVVVIDVDAAPAFNTAWDGTTAALCDANRAACPTCADHTLSTSPAAWTKAAITNILTGLDSIVVIRADSANQAAWEAIFNQEGAAGTGACAAEGDCNIVVVTATASITDDVKTGIDELVGYSTTPLTSPYTAGCNICVASPPAAPTTTAGPPGGNPPPTTAPGGGNPPPTTTTTTTGEASSAARVFAGVVPVATAALLALVL